MSLRAIFLASLLICGLSFWFMDLHAGSGFRYMFLPFLFFISSLSCVLIALGWFYWIIQKWQRNSFGGRRSRSAGGDSSSAGGEGGWSGNWGSDLGGGGDCGGGDGGGGGD